MAAHVRTSQKIRPVCRLQPFLPQHADTVMSWVRGEREAYWLAPRTRPPLTASEVLHWQMPGHQPFLMFEVGYPEPRAYGELNKLGETPGAYWLGHLLVDPEHRGRGFGVQLTKLLLWQAFQHQKAREVSLVVFPDNHQAIAAYKAAGMRESGYETHDFPVYGRQAKLLRMTATGLGAAT